MICPKKMFLAIFQELMVYNTQPIRSMSLKMKNSSKQLETLNTKCTELRSKFEKTISQLIITKTAVWDIANQNPVLNQKLKNSKDKIRHVKCKKDRLEECVNLQVE